MPHTWQRMCSAVHQRRVWKASSSMTALCDGELGQLHTMQSTERFKLLPEDTLGRPALSFTSTETLCRNLCPHGTEFSPRTQKWHFHSQVTPGSPDKLHIHQGQLLSCSHFASWVTGRAAGQVKQFWGKLSHFHV